MNPDLNLLITLTDGQQLFRVALHIEGGLNSVDYDVIRYPLEPENKSILKKCLSLHVRNLGEIVDVEQLFDTVIKGK